MNYGFTFIPNSSISWRFPLAFQCFFAIITIIATCFAPESPRWLVMRDRPEDAQAILAKLSAKPQDDAVVVEEVAYLVAAVNHEASVQKSVTFKEVFSNGEQQALRRILLGSGTPFFQQFGGTNVIAYYLPVVLVRSFGMSDRLALILSAVNSMNLMFWGVVAAFLIDRIGRRRLMFWGATASGVCFAMVAIGLRYSGPNNENQAWSIVAVTFIFVYYVFYGMSLLSIPYMYPAEINSQRMRNTGTSIATAVNWTCVYIVVVITPTAIDNIGWRYYLIYAIFNFSFMPIIWRWYVETANLSLEQVDRLFQIKYEGGKNVSWKEATRLARMEEPHTMEQKVVGSSKHLEVTAVNVKEEDTP